MLKDFSRYYLVFAESKVQAVKYLSRYLDKHNIRDVFQVEDLFEQPKEIDLKVEYTDEKLAEILWYEDEYFFMVRLCASKEDLTHEEFLLEYNSYLKEYFKVIRGN